jgi:hypothetical protein
MLFNGRLLTIVVISSLLIIPSKYIWQSINKLVCTKKTLINLSPLSSPLSFIVLFLCARGTMGHRPINPSYVYFSNDPLINSLTLNSIYSVAHAYKQFGNEENASKLYGKIATDDAIQLIRQETGLTPEAFNSKAQPSFTSRAPFTKVSLKI